MDLNNLPTKVLFKQQCMRTILELKKTKQQREHESINSTFGEFHDEETVSNNKLLSMQIIMCYST